MPRRRSPPPAPLRASAPRRTTAEPRPRPRFSPLALEITVILVVKAVALYVIWLAFFSAPAGRGLDSGGVARSLLNAPAQPQPQETDSASGHGTR